MNARSSAPDALVYSPPARRSLSLHGSLFVVLAVALVLALLAFWPTKAWVPPPHPGLKTPVVFDELLPPPVAPAEPNTPLPAGH